MAMMSQYFSEAELRCPHCGILFVCGDLLFSLDLLRERMGEPMYLTSACRCPEHNEAVGGSTGSLHLTEANKPCKAVDVKATSSSYRYRLIHNAMELGFSGIGIYKAHIHLDTRENYDVLWWG